MSKQKAPYGSWKSPITTDLMLEKSVGLGEISGFDDSLYWIEMRPQEKGRYTIVRYRPDGTMEDVLPEGLNARSRVHEYGGGSYLVINEGVVFVNFNDQDLYLVNQDKKCLRLTEIPDCRFADMIYDDRRKRIICICENHSSPDSEPVNSIVSISLSEKTLPQTLIAGADFYSNPRLNVECDKLCWIEWMHPNMPWDNTSLKLCEILGDGTTGNIKIVADKRESICQPTWLEDRLYFVSDRHGWWNLHYFEDGKIECLLQIESEFAVPQWSFKETHYVFIDRTTIACIYQKEGIAYLSTIDINHGELNTINLNYTDYESLVYLNNKLYCLAGSPTTFPSIIEFDPESNYCKQIKIANEIKFDDGFISIGKSIRFPVSSGLTSHAFFYQPTNKDFEGESSTLPPLIVMSHGGPTGMAHNGLKMVIQYFTSRGFAVMDVNYGGSSGFGRTYRQRLNGQWGIVDVEDCCAAAEYVSDKSWVDSNRLAIRGGSAGGFTTLAALAFKNVFKAGASHYGVSDLEALAKETHKFESRYLDNLIGPYPDSKETYIERSPIHAIERFSCPVIFFQGLEDKIVLPNQAEMMVEALKAKMIPVAYIAYEGEQHGFRQAANIKRTLEAEYYFYASIFGFECAEQIEAIEFL